MCSVWFSIISLSLLAEISIQLISYFAPYFGLASFAPFHSSAGVAHRCYYIAGRALYVSRKLRWDDWVGSQPASKSAKEMKINKNKKRTAYRRERLRRGSSKRDWADRATGVQPNANELPRPFYISLSLSLFLFWLVLVPQSVRRLRLSPQLRGPVLCRSPLLLLLLRWPPFFALPPVSMWSKSAFHRTLWHTDEETRDWCLYRL